MTAKQKKITDRYVMYRYVLSCKCRPLYRVAPPRVGDIITCTEHGEAVVIERKKVEPCPV